MVISRAFWTALKIVGCRMSSVCHPSPGSVSQMKSSGTQGMNRLRRIGVLVAREKRRGLRPGYLPLRPGSSWKASKSGVSGLGRSSPEVRALVELLDTVRLGHSPRTYRAMAGGCSAFTS